MWVPCGSCAILSYFYHLHLPVKLFVIFDLFTGFNSEREQTGLELDRDGPKWKRIQVLAKGVSILLHQLCS